MVGSIESRSRSRNKCVFFCFVLFFLFLFLFKTSQVTGSNKGIGFSIVRALCKELENEIVYLTSRDEGRGKTAIEELKKEGLNPCYHQLDINDQESIKKLRDDLVKDHGGLDILVNKCCHCLQGWYI